MNKIGSAALALALLAAPVTFAALIRTDETNSAIALSFKQLDRDGNKVITPAEWPRDSALFRRVDLNKDGQLTRREFQRSQMELRKGIRQRNRGAGRIDNSRNRGAGRIDASRDGVISFAEWPGSERAFRQLDRDGNGELSRRELRNDRTRHRRGDEDDDDDDDDDDEDEDDEDEDDEERDDPR